ncbi:DUF1704 domain-containing protein [Candidatus Kaiserbacteria bacterium]|nr:DUF1704 domain-containing protein [Candidatus Kaiserbacteria bacterium]
MKRNQFIKQYASDARWFLELKKIKAPLVLHSYRLSKDFLDNQYNLFISDQVRNPEVQPFLYSESDVRLAQDRLIELRSMILQEEQEKSISQAYIRNIDFKLKELNMLMASLAVDCVAFKKANQSLYDSLQQEVVDDILYKLNTKYNSFFPKATPVENLQKLRSKISTLPLENFSTLLPFDTLDVDKSSLYQANTVCAMWSEVLAEVAPAWKCELSDEFQHMHVNIRKRLVSIPNKAKFRGSRINKMLFHEIGTHVLRRENGKKSKLQLLSIGLDNYQPAEEGLSIMMEQIVGGSFKDFGGLDKYLALMIAKGYVDGIERDFRDTFIMLRDYFVARKRVRHNSDDATRIANERAWAICWRIFRGGKPEIPGCCFMKDKIYREGNILMWNLFINNNKHFSNVSAGKFNPADSQHRKLVEKYT